MFLLETSKNVSLATYKALGNPRSLSYNYIIQNRITEY